MAGDALFSHVEKLQGSVPWQSVLDAGTGTYSLEWILGLPTTRWTAVSGDPRVAAKLENILSLEYPKELVEVVVACDGSTDDTEDVVRRYLRHGVRLVPLTRVGKARAVNAAVTLASGDI